MDNTLVEKLSCEDFPAPVGFDLCPEPEPRDTIPAPPPSFDAVDLTDDFPF